MLYVMISNKEYDLGYVSGADTKAELDDPIRVLYLPDIPYAVPESRKSYQSTIVFEYLAFVFGAVLILIGIFYPREKIMKVKN
jgi:hypothetical protein